MLTQAENAKICQWLGRWKVFYHGDDLAWTDADGELLAEPPPQHFDTEEWIGPLLMKAFEKGWKLSNYCRSDWWGFWDGINPGAGYQSVAGESKTGILSESVCRAVLAIIAKEQADAG